MTPYTYLSHPFPRINGVVCVGNAPCHTSGTFSVLLRPSCWEFGVWQVIRQDGMIYMVLEYGEIDLAHLLTKQHDKSKDGRVDENFLRHYWQQVLNVP